MSLTQHLHSSEGAHEEAWQMMDALGSRGKGQYGAHRLAQLPVLLDLQARVAVAA